MSKNKFYVIGGVLLIAFAAFALASFKDAATPYISYEQARSDPRVVQVAGGLLEGTSRYDEQSEALFFTLEDPETQDTLPVRYSGLKPANFEDAVSIVAIGRYDAASEEFHADKLLVKCPSKYQGLEEKEYS